MIEFKEVYQAGLRYLARREYSTIELARKLRAKGFPPDYISQALEDLTTQGYLSDRRFAENYSRYRLNSGWGPVMIVQELLEKGLPSTLIEEQMSVLQEHWLVLACQVREKKFGVGWPQSFVEIAKQKRFLQYRGFTLDHIKQVFDKG